MKTFFKQILFYLVRLHIFITVFYSITLQASSQTNLNSEMIKQKSKGTQNKSQNYLNDKQNSKIQSQNSVQFGPNITGFYPLAHLGSYLKIFKNEIEENYVVVFVADRKKENIKNKIDSEWNALKKKYNQNLIENECAQKDISITCYLLAKENNKFNYLAFKLDSKQVQTVVSVNGLKNLKSLEQVKAQVKF